MTSQADKLMDFKNLLTNQYNRLSAKTILKIGCARVLNGL